MLLLRKYALLFGVIIVGAVPGWAQVTLIPRANVPVPVGPTRDYGTPRIGYGAEAGYWLTSHWGVAFAYDRYRFALRTGIENVDIDSIVVALLNLPEVIALDLRSDSWNGGVRYRTTFSRLTAYVGAEVSTNRITAEGYGISLSQRYWGLAPVVGAEWRLTSRWSGRIDTRLQTIFVRNDIPFVEEVIDRYLIFIPVQIGIVAKFPVRPLYRSGSRE